MIILLLFAAAGFMCVKLVELFAAAGFMCVKLVELYSSFGFMCVKASIVAQPLKAKLESTGVGEC